MTKKTTWGFFVLWVKKTEFFKTRESQVNLYQVTVLCYVILSEEAAFSKQYLANASGSEGTT
jgi:hypothetical protein